MLDNTFCGHLFILSSKLLALRLSRTASHKICIGKAFNIRWVGPFVHVHTEYGILAMINVSFVPAKMLLYAFSHDIGSRQILLSGKLCFSATKLGMLISKLAHLPGPGYISLKHAGSNFDILSSIGWPLKPYTSTPPQKSFRSVMPLVLRPLFWWFLAKHYQLALAH